MFTSLPRLHWFHPPRTYSHLPSSLPILPAKFPRKTLRQANCHVLVCVAPILPDLMISMKNRNITFIWLKKVSIFNTMFHHLKSYAKSVRLCAHLSPPPGQLPFAMTAQSTFTFVNDIHQKFYAKYYVENHWPRQCLAGIFQGLHRGFKLAITPIIYAHLTFWPASSSFPPGPLVILVQVCLTHDAWKYSVYEIITHTHTQGLRRI